MGYEMRLGALANLLAEAERDVEFAEESLKQAKERARLIREESIPELMHEAGVNRMDLETGESITVAREVYVQPKKEDWPAVRAWLEQEQLDGAIKIEVTAPYGRGEADEARALMVELAARGINTKSKEGVHPMTFRKIVKEQLAQGRDVPMDLLNCRIVNTAKIKRKK